MKTFIVDSFTNEKFKGNPAGVCLVEQDLAASLMLNIAKELNLSETAFVKKLEGESQYAIRYFSPKMEIPLCGHATLAASKVLFEQNALATINFQTIENIDLGIRQEAQKIIMEFPIYETTTAEAPEALLAALGLERINNCVYNRETNILLLEIESPIILAKLAPDFNALIRSHDSINGVLVTAPANDNHYDFHSRYFWPWSGTNEDPVTGGTHTFLAKYWATRLGKTKLNSFQSSARTGFMELELLDEAKMLIKGEAVIVLEGQLNL